MTDIAQQVKDALIKAGIETPFASRNEGNASLARDTRQTAIEHNVKGILEALGLDLNDDSLQDTPKRVAKMFIHEVFNGLDYANFPKISTFEDKGTRAEAGIILCKDITLKSHCEHHLVPIIGKAHIAYIPNKRIIGLSKFNRIVKFFASRPQVQERLTAQILVALQTILETEDVAVVTDAEHLCVQMRGVEDSTSSTVVSELGGRFKDIPELRAEYLQLIKG